MGLKVVYILFFTRRSCTGQLATAWKITYGAYEGDHLPSGWLVLDRENTYATGHMVDDGRTCLRRVIRSGYLTS